MDDILLVKKENINRIASKIQLCKQRKITNIKIECQHSNIYQTNNVYQFFMADEDKKIEVTSGLATNIKVQAGKIFVAPGEKGNFMNLQENIFIEEMAFPALFPYGIGGYISSNILSGSDIGFANYCRNCIMLADPKFRNDQIYLFFLLLVKK